jgi:putative tricarboxylic transport membrane protein
VIAFLGVIAAVAAVYTVEAFGMEWETQAGRIGPGFFPRIIGVLLVVLCCVAIARRLRAGREAAGDGARYARMVAIVAGALVAYWIALDWVGAVPASVAFLLGLLWITNPGRPVTNIAVAALLPAALYVLFEIGLNAGLPPGVL